MLAHPVTLHHCPCYTISRSPDHKPLPNFSFGAGGVWQFSACSLRMQSTLQLMCVVAGEEEDLDLGKMVREGEVAWLHKADMPGSGPGHAEHAGETHQQGWHAQRQNPNSPDQGPAAARKRKQPPASRSASAYPGGSTPLLQPPPCSTACIHCLCAHPLLSASALAWALHPLILLGHHHFCQCFLKNASKRLFQASV